MANEFIGKTQRWILDSSSGKDDAVFPGSSADQTHVTHRLLIFAGSEGAGGSDLAQIIAILQLDLKGFPANERMRKVDGVGNRIRTGGINCDEFVSFPQLQFPANSQVSSRTTLLADSRLLDQFHEWPRAAIQDGKLEVIQLDDRVVDASSDESGEQMFGGGDQHALFH